MRLRVHPSHLLQHCHWVHQQPEQESPSHGESSGATHVEKCVCVCVFNNREKSVRWLSFIDHPTRRLRLYRGEALNNTY